MHEDVIARVILDPAFVEKFWSYVTIGDGCWEWRGSHRKNGRGRVYAGPGNGNLHLNTARVSLALAGIDTASSPCVCHHCDNPRCVRPDHLFLGTHKDNMEDCVRKGRLAHRPGELHPRAKLRERDVLAIRERVSRGELHREIAADFGLEKSTISDIARRKLWRHI